MNGLGKPSQSSTNGTNALDGDVTLLSSLLSQLNGSEERDVEGPELQELLKQLETADGVAKGVESRLDELIGSLDQLLGGLEASGQGGSADDQQIERTAEGASGQDSAKCGS